MVGGSSSLNPQSLSELEFFEYLRSAQLRMKLIYYQLQILHKLLPGNGSKVRCTYANRSDRCSAAAVIAREAQRNIKIAFDSHSPTSC